MVMELDMVCHEYNVRPGDTLRSIAAKFSNNKTKAGIDDYLSRMVFSNKANLKHLGANLSLPYAPIPRPFGTICLPPRKMSKRHQLIEHHAMRLTDEPYSTREKLYEISKGDYDLNTVNSAAMLSSALRFMYNHQAAAAGFILTQ